VDSFLSGEIECPRNGSTPVLILGRFTPERKRVLDRLREELRRYNYTPVVFDFERSVNRNLTETVSTLAHMARFVIADLTAARSVPQELQRIVPDLPSVPVQPVLHRSDSEWAMFDDFFDYQTVLPAFEYEMVEELCAALAECVVAPAEQRAREIAERREARTRQL
jgi:hypothetical protein